MHIPGGSSSNANFLRPCSFCSAPAEFSAAIIISTLGKNPRKQKCSRAILLCGHCIQARIGSLRGSATPTLAEHLADAYTAVSEPSSSKPEPEINLAKLCAVMK